MRDKKNAKKQKNKKRPRNCTYNEKCDQAVVESKTKDLFNMLPFRNTNIIDEEDKLFACINYVPGIVPQLKSALKKQGLPLTSDQARLSRKVGILLKNVRGR